MTNIYAAGATTVAKLIFTGLCNIHLYDTITPRETCKKKNSEATNEKIMAWMDTISQKNGTLKLLVENTHTTKTLRFVVIISY